MDFVGVAEGEGVALVHERWFTPKKQEVFWPPYKQQSKFVRALKTGEFPDEENWKLYSISRCFFRSDDYETAHKKLKLCEDTSDVPSDLERTLTQARRKRPTRKLFESDSCDSDDCNHSQSLLPRPPRISHTLNQNKIVISNVENGNRNLNISSTSGNSSNSTETCVSDNSVADIRQTIPALTPQREHFTEHSGSKDNLWKLLVEIREQNKQILARLVKSDGASNSVRIPKDMPVNFPLRRVDDVSLLETYLLEETRVSELSSYLATLGGRSVPTKTNKILKHIFGNELACLYSFYGTRLEKRPFSGLKLCDVIVEAVKRSTANATNKEVEDAVKVWLKHAPKRLKSKEAAKE